MASRVKGTINLTNEQPAEIILRLEPWANEQQIPSRKTVAVNLGGSSEVLLHIFAKPGVIELWTESVDLVLEFASVH
jgi:hypothetical protein